VNPSEVVRIMKQVPKGKLIGSWHGTVGDRKPL
jgi:hypothetical protein